jgi:Pup amidohydrolase
VPARSAASCRSSRRRRPYQLSQRADFFEEEIGLETTLKRPIVNTRDEPHADAQKYRRLHVIVGDANMSEVATYLKVGTTAIVLAMIEDDELGDDWLLGNPVAAIRQVSHDPTLRQTIMLRDGSHHHGARDPVGLLERARKYEQSHGLDCVGEEVGPTSSPWETVLTGLESDPASVANWVDWVAKQRLVDGYAPATASSRVRQAEGDRPAVPRPARRAVPGVARRARHDGDPGRGRRRDDRAADHDTRAYFRGRCLQKYPGDVVAANWDSLVFDIGRDPLRRVPMMEPLRGTAEHVGTLIDESETARELLDRLGQ